LIEGREVEGIDQKRGDAAEASAGQIEAPRDGDEILPGQLRQVGLVDEQADRRIVAMGTEVDPLGDVERRREPG
jgi:hypothetical protein